LYITPKGDKPEYREELKQIEEGCTRIRRALPLPIREGDSSPAQSHKREGLSTLVVHTIVNGAIIEIYGNTAHADARSYQLRLAAVKEVVSLIRHLCKADYERGCIMFGVRLFPLYLVCY
jgi:hypothetical protein